MKLEELVQKRTEKVNKTYFFNEKHPRNLPLDFWFQNSEEGLILFLIIYTQTCQWAQCLSCNLPSQMSQYHVGFQDIMKQIDFIFDTLTSDQKKNLKKIILSNNGSVLDEQTFSTTALIYFIAKMNMHCPNIGILSIETRPEYVDLSELELMHRALAEGDTPTNLEIAVGFEAFDTIVRNDHFKKGLSLKKFEEMAVSVGEYGFHLKCYFMLKPVVGMTTEDAIKDIHNGIDYLADVSKKTNVKINMHLNPTYVATGTPLAEAFANGEYTPPTMTDVIEAVKYGKGKGISIFVGLNDEGLAVEGGSFIRQDEEKLMEVLEEFNRDQNYDCLS